MAGITVWKEVCDDFGISETLKRSVRVASLAHYEREGSHLLTGDGKGAISDLSVKAAELLMLIRKIAIETSDAEWAYIDDDLMGLANQIADKAAGRI